MRRNQINPKIAIDYRTRVKAAQGMSDKKQEFANRSSFDCFKNQ